MPDSVNSPKRRKRRTSLSPIDRIRAQQQSAMAVQMERNAVLQYVGEQLEQLNALLREAGFTPRSVTIDPGFNPQRPPAHQLYQPPPPLPQAEAWPPCTWCGGGKPTKPFSVGNGVIQNLCAVHAGAQRAEAAGPGGEYAKAAAEKMSVNYTDARPQPPIMNSAKTIMQPIAQDYQAAQAATNESNGVQPPPAGFEEMPE